jgi:hypothetical protein
VLSIVTFYDGRIKSDGGPNPVRGPVVDHTSYGNIASKMFFAWNVVLFTEYSRTPCNESSSNKIGNEVKCFIA